MAKQTFHTKLIGLLKNTPDYVDEESGELLRARLIHHAYQLDHNLIQLLLTENEIADRFFEEIGGRWIFNYNTFVDYVNRHEFLPGSHTKFRNKIILNIDDKSLTERGEVALVWPYKDCVLEGGQTREEEKRKEIFFNEVIAQSEINRMLHPKVLTNWKRYTTTGEQDVTEIKRDENGTIRENLIIKGNNLIALHSLKKEFGGKVKLIYIDPPYNTGNDSFGYNNNFNHSTWLTFMNNRLEVAKELLKDNGIIFIHIDDNEMHYLKVLTDNIFGRDNFIATVPRKTRSGRNNVPYNLSQDFDWMLMYTNKASKKDDLFQRSVSRKYYKTPDFPDDEWRLSDITVQATIHERQNCNFTMINPKNGEEFPVNPDRCWGFPADSFDDYYKRGKVVFPGDYDFLDIRKPALRVFKSEEIERRGDDFDKSSVSSNFLNLAMDELLKDMVNKKGTDEIRELFGKKAFAYPKNELLMQRIIEYTTKEEDIVLDFYLGSGTTAAVSHKMNRQWIAVEQMDYVEKESLGRIKKVIAGEQGGISKSVNWHGGGDFIYCELKQYNDRFLEKLQSTQSSEELLEIWRDMSNESFLNWYVKPDMPAEAKEHFSAINDVEEQKRCLAELLDKNQLYVHLSEIEDEKFDVSEVDKVLNKKFYGGGDDV
ncbi:MAG: site-specific DNA-methyltransferase [Candidatus Poribacteria bacterium]|nr:site-specific DNA-methyltransferase [Candidatus Poribacteria bacterium]